MKNSKLLIFAMKIIKELCASDTDGCSVCPMYNNCNSRESKTVYPIYWNIPEETED